MKLIIWSTNNKHDAIKFTLTCNFNQINFLDVAVIKEGDHLETDLSLKCTDKNNYLLASNFHLVVKIMFQPIWGKKICTKEGSGRNGNEVSRDAAVKNHGSAWNVIVHLLGNVDIY